MESSNLQKRKKRYIDQEENSEQFPNKRLKNRAKNFKTSESEENSTRDTSIQNSIVYYENILKDLKKGINNSMIEECISNVLQESEGKEIELSCHSLVSHCLELLLSQCEDLDVIQRFMTAFIENKIPACTSANASHITELLIYHALKAIQKDFEAMQTEDSEKKSFSIYCTNWITEFGYFALENLHDFLSSQFSCHVLSTLVRALAGDLPGSSKFMSKSLKSHKQEFHSQFGGANSKKIQEQKPVILEQIPNVFSDILKKLYKAIVKSESLDSYVNDSSSATVVEALLFALKKRLPKCCKKMIKKVLKKLFVYINDENIPSILLHKNASFVFDEMFKVAEDDLQQELWRQYMSDHIAKLVVHPVGNFVIQRLFDAIKSRTLLDSVCEDTWCLFDAIHERKHFGVFVSIATACVRLGVQQSFFMQSIMQCLNCLEPVERQDLIIPLLLGFQKYESFTSNSLSESTFKICLQGSLVAQAILKYQKPLKAVRSILHMSPEDLEYLFGHPQGCHVLNSYFGSITVGDKNKEALLLHLQPVLVNIACDRNKSLTLSRIWTCLSLKSKEMVARYLAQHQDTLRACSSGYAVFQKFGIVRLKKINEWRQMQSNISNIKKPKH